MILAEHVRGWDRELERRRHGPQERVAEIVRGLLSRPDTDRAELVTWVEDGDAMLTAIALEYLVQDPEEASGLLLADLVANAEQTESWFQPALLAALRKKLPAVASTAICYLDQPWGEQNFPLALISHLSGVAPLEALRIGADFLAHRLPSASDSETESLVQAFVNSYLAGDGALLGELVREVMRRDLEQGRRFGSAVVDTLGKPWIVKRYGPEAKDSLVKRIRAALTLAH